jgi:hypothetical protein
VDLIFCSVVVLETVVLVLRLLEDIRWRLGLGLVYIGLGLV